jgi:DNA polymerase-3 subunit epsilon
MSTASTWPDGPMCGFDVESTAADPETARIVSAAIVMDDPTSTDGPHTRTWLANPGIDIPLEATAVHGISTEVAREHGETPRVVLAGIVNTLATIADKYGPIPLVIYNATYDLTVMDREMRRNGWADGLTIPTLPIIDPLVSDRRLDGYRSGRRTLTAVSAAYGVATVGAHTADGDVRTSLQLARAMGQKYRRFGAADPADLQEAQRTAYKEWADQFKSYRNRFDPDFQCGNQWPLIPPAANSATQRGDTAHGI